jgi:uncharacterized protein YyaL (SSP411 family)
MAFGGIYDQLGAFSRYSTDKIGLFPILKKCFMTMPISGLYSHAYN